MLLRSGRRFALPLLLVAAGFPWAAPASAQDYEARIAAAKKQAVAYLYGRQRQDIRLVRIENQMSIVESVAGKSFTVSGNSVRAGRGYNNVFAAIPPGYFDPEPLGDIDWANAGGTTALVTLALLAAGETPANSPKLQQAIDCLAGIYCADMGGQVSKNVTGRTLKAGMQGTYALALHACVLEHVYNLEKNPAKKTAHKKLIEAIGRKIQSGYRPDGGYDYFLAGSDRWDMSNTQYAMLALWAVQNVTGEVSLKTLTHLNNFYIKNQNGDGGYPYAQSSSGSTANMTAGAVASLMLIVDILHTKGIERPQSHPYKPGTLPGQTVEAASRGLEWFSRDFKPTPDGYFLYGTERIGLATGYKRFGQHDWYRDGVDVLLKTQAGDGHWNKPAFGGYTTDDVLNTAFCLLFLAHGSPPTLINKLRWGPADDYSWNNYPRDCANLARWFNRTFEAAAGWQIVDFTSPEDWSDAPILYICGATAPRFEEPQVEALRRYVDRGGTLLCVGCGNGKEFAEGIRDLGRRLYNGTEYPDFQMSPVPADHPVYTLNSSQRDRLSRLKMWHMHNGARSFLFLLSEDIAYVWNNGRATNREELYYLISNLRYYATDKALTLPPKLRPLDPEIEDEEKIPAFVLASIKYTSAGEVTIPDDDGKPQKVKTVSDWNSVPQGWKSLNPHFVQKTGLRIDEIRGVELTAPNLRGYPAIHLAGRRPFTLSDAEKAGLKIYLEKGGILIAEDVGAGRKREFLESAQKHLKDMFPKAVVKQLPEDHPLFTGAFDKSVGPIKEALYSRAVRIAEPNSKTADMSALMIDGRPAVLLSRFDFSSGLSGAVYYDRFGYQPETARHLAMNILTWVRSVRGVKEK